MRQPIPRNVACVLLFGLAALASLGLLAKAPADGKREDAAEQAVSRPLVPVFAETRPAGNPRALNLIVDERKVLGWIGGTQDRSGGKVTVVAGERRETAVVGDDNTFTWEYAVAEPTLATFRLGDLSASEMLGPLKPQEPTAFFVIDRTVYRPGHRLQFAAFLRRTEGRGEFAPLAGQEVEVLLTSRSRKTVAARMRLVSDEFGRITGEYEFQDADPLDAYDLSIPGYRGSAEVTLAEFRKSKVKLNIEGEVAGSELRLTFQAVDFLNNPVAGSKVDYKVQIVRHEQDEGEKAGREGGEGGLKSPRRLSGREFAYHETAAAWPFDPEHATEDERLLWEAGLTAYPAGRRSGREVVAERTGAMPVGLEGRAEQTLALEKEWLDSGHRVVVEGVLVDYNGHEQRASRAFPLGKATRDGLELSLAKRQYAAGEPIRAEIAGPEPASETPPYTTATVVVMKLVPPSAIHISPYGRYPAWQARPIWYAGGAHNAPFLDARISRISASGRQTSAWQRAPSVTATTIERQLVTAVVVQGGAANVTLDEPGAYKLVCMAELPDGRRLTSEAGCVVREPDEMPGLVLKLDGDEFRAGDVLSGEIHSRYAGARVLLTLRDSGGVRFWRTYTLDGGTLRFRERLPEGLRYGVSIDVQYRDEQGRAHLAGRFVRVVPDDRIVTVTARMPEVCEPGDEVTIDLQVDRREPVDLVVSVYDESLLAIASDKSVDIRSFYLADERVRDEADRDRLRRRLGGVTVRELVERAETLLKDNPQLAETTEGGLLNHAISSYRSGRLINPTVVRALLGVAGIDVRHVLFARYGGNWFHWFQAADEERAPLRLFDLLHTDQNGWRLRYQFVGEMLLLVEQHPSSPYPIGMWEDTRIFSYYVGAARGDPRHSVSGNSLLSAPSGQSFISHLPPVGGTLELIGDATPGGPIRRDFSDSAYWNARVRTDDAGQARITFKLPDSLTNWQVVVTAVSPRMHVGQTRERFRTYRPIMVWPILPRVFTEGDQVRLYGSVHNRTGDPQEIDVSLDVANGHVLSQREVRVRVPAEGNVPVYWTFQPEEAGYAELLMTARCGAGSDASLKRLPVVRFGAEQVVTRSGFVRDATSLTVPADVHLDASELEVTFVPSLAEDLVQSLDYLVEYPYGCVEQTMSRFLPAVRVAQTLERAKIDDPALRKKLPEVVEAGVKRLLEHQKPDGGWGWHGGSQTHEMMTPYALYGLLQAEQAGYTIPNEHAIQKGLIRVRAFIESIPAEQPADRIYCMYVFAHRNDLKPEWWAFIEQQLDAGRPSDYALALSLEMAVKAEKVELADRLAAALRRTAQQQEGAAWWTTAGFSRWGSDRFEITAAVLKALVAHDPDDELIAPVLSFFATTKRGNRWNSTKDTAMILFALCDYLAAQDHRPGARRVVSVQINDGDPQPVELVSGKVQKLTFAGRSLRHGENVIRFDGKVPGAMFRATFRHWENRRDVPPMETVLQVRRQFFLLDETGRPSREVKPGESVPRGSYLQSVVRVRHKLGAQMSYVLVENPKPSCCEIVPAADRRFPQDSTQHALREDRTAGVVWHHEQTGAEIIDRCILHAELAGEYLLPPARVELMYETEVRGHSGTFYFTVQR